MKKLSKKLLAMLLVIVMLVPTGALMVQTSASTVSIPDDAVSFNGHYYKIYNYYLNWDDAQANCELLGGHLVTITSAEEQKFIENLATKNDKLFFWLGGKRSGESFTWVTGESWSYENWQSGEPYDIDGTEDCVCIVNGDTYEYHKHLDGTWLDVAYNNPDIYTENKTEAGFICEWESGEQYPDGYDPDFDKYTFPNLDETISSDIYINAYGTVKGAWLHFLQEDGSKHGHCYGMTSTTAALLKYSSVINTFESCYVDGYFVDTLSAIYPEYTSNLFGVDARTYIKYGYVYQFDNDVQKAEKASKNNIQGLYNAVKNYVNGTGNPVIINVYHDGLTGRKDGHSVFAVGLRESDHYYYILINDSNIYYETQQLKISKDFSSWDYTVNDIYSYSSEDGHFTYSFPADVVYNVGLLLNDNNTSFMSANTNLVASTGSISTEANIKEILSSTGDNNETDNNYNLYWLNDNKSNLSITAIEDAEITVTDINSSVTATINADANAQFNVDDDSTNSIKYTSNNGDNTNIVFTTADKNGDLIKTTITGTASGNEVTATEITNGVQVTGLNDITVTYETADGTDTATANITDGKTINIVTDDTSNSVEFDWDCSHLCHNSNTFIQFIWKIVSFFYRIFGMNQYCDCGMAHW